MSVVSSTWEFIRDNQDRFNDLLLAHVRLSLVALAIAVALYVPLGILLSRLQRGGSPVVGALSALRVIPSLALVFIFVPWLGFGYRPALLALVLLAAPPILVSTYTGMQNVDPAVVDAARGMGMTPVEVFARVQLPLALPLLVAGVRSASVEIVASATLASMIGVKTLGQFIFTGISLLDTTYLLAGGIPIVLLVLLFEVVFGALERVAAPGGSASRASTTLSPNELSEGVSVS